MSTTSFAAQPAHALELGRLFAADLPERFASYDSADRTVRDLALTALSHQPSLSEAATRFYGRRALQTAVYGMSVDNDATAQLARIAPSAAGDRGIAQDILALVKEQLQAARADGTSVVLEAGASETFDALLQVRPGIADGLGAEGVALLQRFADAALTSSQFEPDRGSMSETVSAIAGVAGALSGRGEGSWDGARTLALMERHPELAPQAARLSLLLGEAPSQTTAERLLVGTEQSLARIDDRSLFYNEAWLGGRLKLLAKVHAAMGDAAPDPVQVQQRLLGAISADAADVQARVADLLSTAPQRPAVEVKRVDGRPYFVTDSAKASAAPAYVPEGPTDRALAVKALAEGDRRFAFHDGGDQALLALGDPAYSEQVAKAVTSVLDTGSGYGSALRRMFSRLQTLSAVFPEEAARALGVLANLFEASVERSAAATRMNVYAFEDSTLPDAFRGPLLRATTTVLAKAFEEQPDQRREVESPLAFGFRELAAVTPGWVDGLSDAEVSAVREALEAVPAPQARDDDTRAETAHLWQEESAEAKALIQGS